jgi:NADH-quinone oxidoreductase subunit A
MLLAYASVAAFFVVAAAFMLGSMLVGKLIRPDHPYAEKLATYECGEEAVGQAWFSFNPRFYIVALIFIVFDVEIAFIYPVAVVLKRWVLQGRGVAAVAEIFAFVAVLLLGLAYVWAKGDLDWIRAMRRAPVSDRVALSRARLASASAFPGFGRDPELVSLTEEDIHA